MSMAAFRSKIIKSVRLLKPDTLVLVAMTAWWMLNLLQAALTGLANDEAYYWYFAQHLDWGYFDHPPMVALLVWLSAWAPGILGIRFFCVLLQPLYLLLFWHIIRPQHPSYRDALLYSLICFSMPMLQLYGFLAVPDAPLLMTIALFLWAFKRFSEKDTGANAILLAVSVALMGYSKYHGALVVAFAVLANPRMLKSMNLWKAGIMCVVLLLPHLLWQQNHGWPTVRYHLMERNRAYEVQYTLEYLLNLLLVFNPLWVYHYVRGCSGIIRRLKSLSPFQRALLAIGIGFPLFFLFSTLRGHTQPQWLLPAVFPLIALLLTMTRSSERTARYVRGVGVASLVLFLIVRVIVVTNPLHLKGEIWDNEASYASIAEVAGSRPVQFMHDYAHAAKYEYYTGKQAIAAPYYFRRHSQWQFDTTDRAFAHRSVVVGNFTNRQAESVELANGMTFHYTVFDDFLPMRQLVVEPESVTTVDTDSIDVLLAVYNPCDCDFFTSEEHRMRVIMYFCLGDRNMPCTNCFLSDTLYAHDTTILNCRMSLPESVTSGKHLCGFCLGIDGFAPSDNAQLQSFDIVR